MLQYINSIDIRYTCHLIYQTFKIPIRFLDKDKNIVYECSSKNMFSPFLASKEVQLNELLNDNIPQNFPIIKSNEYYENFIIIHTRSKGCKDGTFIVGPSTCSELLPTQIGGIINDSNLIINKEEVRNYYDSLPIIKNLTLIHISVLLYYLIYKKKLDVTTVQQKNNLFENTDYDLYVSMRQENSFIHHDFATEKKFFKWIGNGDKKEMLKHYCALDQSTFGILSLTSEVRNRKYFSISMITLACRYAIEGGLPSEIAYALSDLYIQSLDKLNNLKDINRLLEEVLCAYADYVNEYRTKKYSQTILACQNYITRNLYQEISLKDLADHIHMHPNYLSTLFKKEVGISLSIYIQQEKIEEAKRLLALTAHSLTDIYSLLNFADQSYFTRVFKKNTGYTPKLFRQKHSIL
ncbi:helix-turn-helix domain-containing protein [Bacillus mycoides]|uniref:Transcriptional regulator, AraC family n=1 Tax=Bacillus mycoides TaxID=1405 RepID=A0A1G4EXN6_BACMY|nr:helix-turn-helix domain-containing protein [Bacillus mycoides]SCB71501.1 Transcriptional regulator, AraC family [Bacillus mycoides]